MDRFTLVEVVDPSEQEWFDGLDDSEEETPPPPNRALEDVPTEGDTVGSESSSEEE
jgi:hypothetical protein